MEQMMLYELSESQALQAETALRFQRYNQNGTHVTDQSGRMIWKPDYEQSARIDDVLQVLRTPVRVQATEMADNLHSAATSALEWIDKVFSPDIFDGSSGDEGVVHVVEIRENLRRALESPTPVQPVPMEVLVALRLLINGDIAWDWIAFGGYMSTVAIVREWLNRQQPDGAE